MQIYLLLGMIILILSCLVSCFWIRLKICTAKRLTLSTFASGWTASGNVLTKERLEVTVPLFGNEKWCCAHQRVSFHRFQSICFLYNSHSLLCLCFSKVPYQENGCDCGVFVCRYAYNLYTIRHQKFTLLGMRETPQFLSRITRGAAFQFDMSDIARIREEIGVLIDHLSKHYLLVKE